MKKLQMMTKKTKTWIQNPWTIGIGAPILAIFATRILDSIIGTNILGAAINLIKTFLFIIRDFFQSKYEVSLWFLILLPILLIGIIIVALWILSLSSPNKNTVLDLRPLFLDYKEDTFGGVLYRWDYLKDFSDKYRIVEISVFCPICICSLVADRCPVCNRFFYGNIKSDTEIIALVKHKIETQITKRN